MKELWVQIKPECWWKYEGACNLIGRLDQPHRVIRSGSYFYFIHDEYVDKEDCTVVSEPAIAYL